MATNPEQKATPVKIADDKKVREAAAKVIQRDRELLKRLAQ